MGVKALWLVWEGSHRFGVVLSAICSLLCMRHASLSRTLRLSSSLHPCVITCTIAKYGKEEEGHVCLGGSRIIQV